MLSIVWVCFGLTQLCLAEPGVLSLRTFKNHQKHAYAVRNWDTNSLTKRAPFSVDLQSYPYIGGGFYYVNATVGDPPQDIPLDIDTGSSDIWMFGINSCQNTTSICIGNSFDETASKTATLIDKGGFHLRYYTEGSGVTGDYITDSFTIGKQTMKNLTMGLARKATSAATGIMGVSFASGESIVDNEEGQGEINPQPYPSLLDVMKQQGLISTRAFSLYLDDLAADTGSILFGGYDKAKFKGDLGILQIQRDARSKTYSSFSVILNSVGVTDSTGSTVLTTSNMPNVILLDSGSAFTLIPSDLLDQLVRYFGAVQYENFHWVVPCALDGLTGTLDYQFSGPTGPLVSVPFTELVVPIIDLATGYHFTDSDGDPLCRLGLSAPMSADMPLILGDTFLRSAYVVYDLDNLQIGIAQTIFNMTDSDIEVISASTGQNLPGKIASAATTIAQTKTEDVGGGAGTLLTSTPITALTTFGSALGASALTGYKTTYSTQATVAPGPSSSGTGSTAGAPKKADATSLQGSAGGHWKAVFVQCILSLVALCVGGILIL
jgi:hypothetical protein